jgi:hypothetical protein
MASLFIAIIGKLSDLPLQIPGQVIMLKFNQALHGPMIPLDLALGV